jgi:FkbM family methyltransferase
LEPNPENFEMAASNLKPYGDRVNLLRKGLYISEIKQRFSGKSTGGSIAESGFEIECTTIPTILDKYKIQYLDILKMDIEGAEEKIFSSLTENWINRVGLLIIEIHGSHVEKMILKVLKNYNFKVKRYRSVWYCEK